MTIDVVCLEGDGIGPEVTAAMKQVVAATGVDIHWIDMPAGLGALNTHGNPLPQETVDAIRHHRLAIKGPTNTPQGKGFHSINVELRKLFDLHVGYRPFLSFDFPDQKPVDILLYRQNTEGLYACSEVRSDDGPDGTTVQLTANFSERAIFRLAEKAFADADRLGRKKVTIVTKSNIHKLWGYLYIETFKKVARHYTHIEASELLIDATSMMLQTRTDQFDMIVTENMFGDILSDLCAGLIGGLGMAAGANIGDDCAIYEAVHGSADDIAGKGIANPTALILSAVMLLKDNGFPEEGERINQALRAVIRRGEYVTGDLVNFYPAHAPPTVVGTERFTQLVRGNL